MAQHHRHDLRSVVRRHRGPVIVWCLAVAAVAFLLQRRVTVVEALGLVQAPNVVVSPLEVGQIARLDVDLLQDVRQGQILVHMDDTRLRAEAAVIAAEAEALRLELQQSLDERRLDEVSELRRFTADVEQARLHVLEVLAILEPDRVMLADQERELASYNELLVGEMVSAREVERIQAERDALAEKVAEHESILVDARADLTAAEARRAAFLRQRPELAEAESAADPALVAIEARVTVLERRLDEVAVRREDLRLVAPFDGVVVQIPAYRGQVVRPGDPILVLTAARAEQIVVWLDEASIDRLRGRDNLEATVIQVRNGRSSHAVCPVVRVGPAVVMVPEELWPSPGRPMRGRPVVLAVPSWLDLAPGELVTVRWG